MASKKLETRSPFEGEDNKEHFGFAWDGEPTKKSGGVAIKWMLTIKLVEAAKRQHRSCLEPDEQEVCETRLVDNLIGVTPPRSMFFRWIGGIRQKDRIEEFFEGSNEPDKSRCRCQTSNPAQGAVKSVPASSTRGYRLPTPWQNSRLSTSSSSCDRSEIVLVD